jgi:hypothetical protein
LIKKYTEQQKMLEITENLIHWLKKLNTKSLRYSSLKKILMNIKLK